MIIFLSLFSGPFPEKRRNSPVLMRYRIARSSSSDQHKDICTGEEHVKPVQILAESSVFCFSVTEISLHYEKCLLHFTSNIGKNSKTESGK